MANRKVTMTDLRVIIREFAKGTPLREIERKLGLSWRFRSKGPQKTDDYFGVKPPKKDFIINKKGRELGSRASNFRSIATQIS